MKKDTQFISRALMFCVLGILLLFSCQKDETLLDWQGQILEVSPAKLASDKNFISLTNLRADLHSEMVSEFLKLPKNDLDEMRRIFRSKDENLFLKAVQDGKVKSMITFQERSSLLLEKLDHTYKLRNIPISSLTELLNSAEDLALRSARGCIGPECPSVPDALDCGEAPEFCYGSGGGTPAPTPRTQAQKYQDCLAAATITYLSALATCNCCATKPVECRQIAGYVYTAANSICTYKWITQSF